MAYPADLNDKIVVFINRAQTKLGVLSEDIANKVSRNARLEAYRDQSQMGFELDCFIRSLDNNFNNWTNKEVETYIELWNAKANLTHLPYFTHEAYNLNVVYRDESETEPGADLTLATLGATLQTASADTPLDDDTFNFYDAVDAVLKKITWANIKATLKTYFDTLYTLRANNLSDVANAATARANLELVGLQDLYIPAVAMWPRTTGGCASLAKTEIATSLVNIQTLDFDQTSSEYAQFTISLPKNWNNGTVTATFYWTAASGSGTVTWGIQGGAYSNDDALTTALGTEQTVTDTLIATNDLHISSATSAITLAGTPADADFLAFQIYRDITDTLSADAKLLGVVIQLTTDAAVSA